MKTITRVTKIYTSYRAQFKTEDEVDSYLSVITETMEKDGFDLLTTEKWQSNNMWNVLVQFERTENINTKYSDNETST